jgi:2-polyprenyl-6-hydroxyphenyl methylase/3-demethylubiquinone-9 3-methyltransferase
MNEILRRFITSQVNLAAMLDSWLPEDYRIDGNRYFIDQFFPRFLQHGQVVYDIGGGRHPIVTAEQKERYGLTVIGVDISEAELSAAPVGLYDRTVSADITQFSGTGDADLVICQALLEHVKSTDRAFVAIAGILKPGGQALIFVPSRNAVFARLNLLLPERIKRAILYAIFPKAKEGQGFRSYYDRCTPPAFEAMAAAVGLLTVERHLFYKSSYFSFFLPLYGLWRLWIIAFRLVSPEQAAETFALALRKPLH